MSVGKTESRIQESLGSVIFCSAAWSHHRVGKSAVWKGFYQGAHKECANMHLHLDHITGRTRSTLKQVQKKM